MTRIRRLLTFVVPVITGLGLVLSVYGLITAQAEDGHDHGHGHSESATTVSTQVVSEVLSFQIVDGVRPSDYRIIDISSDVELVAGVPMWISLLNTGNQVHHISVHQQGYHHHDPIFEAELGPGGTAATVVVLPAGEYIIMCHTGGPGHDTMSNSFEVLPGS